MKFAKSEFEDRSGCGQGALRHHAAGESGLRDGTFIVPDPARRAGIRNGFLTKIIQND